MGNQYSEATTQGTWDCEWLIHLPGERYNAEIVQWPGLKPAEREARSGAYVPFHAHLTRGPIATLLSSLEHIADADCAAQGGLVTHSAFGCNEKPLGQVHLHAASGANGQRGVRRVENARLPGVEV